MFRVIHYNKHRVCTAGLPFPGHPWISDIFHCRIPGNGSASFPAKMGTMQLTALLLFSVIVACSIDNS